MILIGIELPLSTLVDEIADEMNGTIDEPDTGASYVHAADGPLSGNVVARHAFSEKASFATGGTFDLAATEDSVSAGNAGVWSNRVVRDPIAHRGEYLRAEIAKPAVAKNDDE